MSVILSEGHDITVTVKEKYFKIKYRLGGILLAFLDCDLFYSCNSGTKNYFAIIVSYM
jgi:hypothetical protein